MDSKKSSGSYQTRLFWLISCFTWILTFAFFVLQYTREKEFKIETLDSQLQVLNTEILSEMEYAGGIDALKARKAVNKDDSVRITVIDFKGKILYDTDAEAVLENHSDRKEFTDAMNAGHGYTVRRASRSVDNIYFYSATKGDSVVVRSAMPYNGSLVQTLQVDWLYGLIIVIIAVVVNIIAYFAIRRIGQTVKSLKEFATKAEEGTLDVSERYEFPQDELGDISSTIVNMYISEQKMRKERDENVEAAIFEEQEKQRIKQQLTNNINHEIKTPVHAIQACLETMVNNGERLSKEQLTELLENAYGHVKQLSSLLHDISIITRISEASDRIEREKVNINGVLKGLEKDMDIYPAEKRMRLNIDVPDNMVINGNQSLVESIFSNLVNNALAYSGGRDIYITATDEGDCYMFEFADNGIGVDKEHLNKLFERFYRVDSGRSRKMGGTGLGLSIVKNAIVFHGGSIKVSNRRKGGLQFTFTLCK